MNAEPEPTRILPAYECWALLRATPVGRLALCQDGQPEIFPVNFAVDHGTIVYRTSEGTKSHATEKAPVAFEVDGFYPDSSADGGADGSTVEGRSIVWSVVVKGNAATIAVTSELMDTVQLSLHPWESGRKDRFMRLVPGTISGRAFTLRSPDAPTNPEMSAP